MNEMVESFKPIFRMMGGVLALLVVLRMFLLWWNSPKQKGKRGEKLVAGRLRKGLPDEYRILNDIYLPLPDGTTTQVDHIVVSQYGIFVVETKTYSGWIFGDEKSKEWTQSIYRKKSRFQNPMRQNYKHICALADNLGIDKSYFIGVVAFTGDCTFKTEMPDGVVYSRRAADYILSHSTPMIKPWQIDELTSAIAEWQGTLSEKQIDSHVCTLQRRNGVESAVDIFFDSQRLLNKAAQHTTAHRCAGIIQNAEESSLFLA